MKKVLEYSYSLGAKLPLDNYEQRAPLYHKKATVELEDGESYDPAQDIASWREEFAKAIGQEKISTAWEKLRAKYPDSTYTKDGISYLRVSTILGWDFPDVGDPVKKKVAQSIGTLQHARIKQFFSDLSAGQEVWPLTNIDVDPMTAHWIKGFDWAALDKEHDFYGWFKTYTAAFEWGKGEETVYHPQMLFAGTYDKMAMMDGKRVLLDWKCWGKTQAKYHDDRVTKAFKQMAAYAMCIPQRVQALVIVPLMEGFQAPISTTEVAKYQSMFLSDYQRFSAVHHVTLPACSISDGGAL